MGWSTASPPSCDKLFLSCEQFNLTQTILFLTSDDDDDEGEEEGDCDDDYDDGDATDDNNNLYKVKASV